MPELLIIPAVVAGLVVLIWVVDLRLARRACRRLAPAQHSTGHHPQHNNPLVDEAHGHARVNENNQQMGGF